MGQAAHGQAGQPGGGAGGGAEPGNDVMLLRGHHLKHRANLNRDFGSKLNNKLTA